MALTTSRIPSWITLLLVYVLLTICFPTACLAQESTDMMISITARNPDPSSTTTTSQASSTSSAPAQTHTVQVGLVNYAFNPDVTVAAVGDTIEFDFYPSNHSVVRAAYGYPCIPYELVTNKQGFFSGFDAVDKVLDDPPKWSIQINDTNPIFFYCSAPGACLTYGMVGAINPNSSTSITTQHKLALNSSYMLQPGESFPAESPLPSSTPVSSTTASSVPVASHSEKKGVSAGTIAGIVIAALSVVVLAALLFFFWGRTKSLKDEVDRKQSTVRRVSPDSSTAMLEAGRHAAERDAGRGIYQHYTSPAPGQHREYPSATSPAYSPAAFSPPPPGLHRAASHRSGGGAFELPPSAEYARTPLLARDHQQRYEPHGLAVQDVKLGPYGQQMVNEPVPSYYDTVFRPGPLHVNEAQGPAEMDGTTPLMKPTWEEVEAEEGRMF